MDPLHPDHGLVFRSFIHIFDEIKRRSDDTTHVIRASYLEIYNEKVRKLARDDKWRGNRHLSQCDRVICPQVIDLLNPGTKRSNLNVRWDKKSRAFVVDNLFSIECNELDDLVAVLEEGNFRTSNQITTFSCVRFRKSFVPSNRETVGSLFLTPEF